MLRVITAFIFFSTPILAENGITVLDPDFFDRMEQPSYSTRYENPSYACYRISGSTQKVMHTKAFKKIQKTCKAELQFRHIQPRNRLVPLNQQLEHETGYLLVCCKPKPRNFRKRGFSE